MAQIQVGLRPVVGDEHLPVLVGAHGPRVHVQVGVQLLDLDPQAPLLQQTAQTGRRDALAQTGHYAAGDENVLHCHNDPSINLIHCLKKYRVIVLLSCPTVKKKHG